MKKEGRPHHPFDSHAPVLDLERSDVFGDSEVVRAFCPSLKITRNAVSLDDVGTCPLCKGVHPDIAKPGEDTCEFVILAEKQIFLPGAEPRSAVFA